ncbi:uncharacterized protein [Drosophila tropicalis]|uniref:uncharacterized protein n=1 Tax=Drosophila tropicalis TaxID=46794 RepID=UPI0035ABAE38
MQMTINSARCLTFYPARLAHMHQGACYKENYYDVLNIPRNSDNQEIKRAFIELSKKYHPDAIAKRPLRSQYDSHHKMNSPAVDTSYSYVNVHKNWQQYQAAKRSERSSRAAASRSRDQRNRQLFKINKLAPLSPYSQE